MIEQIVALYMYHTGDQFMLVVLVTLILTAIHLIAVVFLDKLQVENF